MLRLPRFLRASADVDEAQRLAGEAQRLAAEAQRLADETQRQAESRPSSTVAKWGLWVAIFAAVFTAAQAGFLWVQITDQQAATDLDGAVLTATVQVVKSYEVPAVYEYGDDGVEYVFPEGADASEEGTKARVEVRNTGRSAGSIIQATVQFGDAQLSADELVCGVDVTGTERRYVPCEIPLVVAPNGVTVFTFVIPQSRICVEWPPPGPQEVVVSLQSGSGVEIVEETGVMKTLAAECPRMTE